VHVVDLGKISFMQQKDTLKLYNIQKRWINQIMKSLILDQAMDSVSCRLSNNLNRFYKRISPIIWGQEGQEILRGWSQLQKRRKKFLDGSLRKR